MDDRDRDRDMPRGEGRPEGDAPRSRFGSGAQGPRPGGPGGSGPGGSGPGGGGPGGGAGRPPRRGGGGGGGRGFGRRKICPFCTDNVDDVDYKDIARLRRHLSERGKIEPRRKQGTCARHQRSLTTAIKRARHVALLPYTNAAR